MENIFNEEALSKVLAYKLIEVLKVEQIISENDYRGIIQERKKDLESFSKKNLLKREGT